MSLLNLNALPVLQREIREGARRPVNYRLRLFSAAAGTLVLWAILANFNGSSAQVGGWLFGGLHTLLLVLIVLIVPALAADCIAREKREGTLSLLFLTPLNAGGIVAGKALAHALRAFTLWLAVLPMLTIPFLTGGVTWGDAFTALNLEFCATVLCLAAGLLASSLGLRRNAVFMLALLFGVLFLFVFMELGQFFIMANWTSTGFQQSWFDMTFETVALYCGLFNFLAPGNQGQWSSIATFSPVLSKTWELICLVSPLVALGLFFLIVRFAAHRVERSWQDKIPSARQESLIRRYCTPVFRRRFRRQMQLTLDKNPIVWLQQYSWKARVSKWGLCLLFVLVLTASIDANPWPDVMITAEVGLLLVLAGIYTFFGVSGFLEEKRSGALELLLVTPLSVNALIFGRVWGLWKQFLPAALVLASCYACITWDEKSRSYDFNDFKQPIFLISCAYLALPIFATYFALRVKNLMAAAVLTWIALCIPFILITGMFMDLYQYDSSSVLSAFFFSYLALSFVACFLLRHSLSRRIYSF